MENKKNKKLKMKKSSRLVRKCKTVQIFVSTGLHLVVLSMLEMKKGFFIWFESELIMVQPCWCAVYQ